MDVFESHRVPPMLDFIESKRNPGRFYYGLDAMTTIRTMAEMPGKDRNKLDLNKFFAVSLKFCVI